MIRHATCKCSRLIIANDAELKISREAPECDWFRDLLAKSPPHSTEVEVLDAETGQKLRQR